MVITATKRQTNLQDTALAVTAISGEMINKRGITGMGDYLSTVPGVTMQDRGSVGNSIVIRGIAVEPQREMEAVGTYFGNTPISGLAPFTGSGHIDFKMVDIERVEVLRGPQGSLYGSGSMGGTVRVIPVSPDTTNIEGNVSAQYSETWEYGSDNNILKGTINLPVVNNSLALRGVGYRFSESGYVENIAASYTGTGNVSDIVDAWGGTANNQSNRGQQEILGSRLSLLWVPVEKMELSLNYAWQKMDQSGFPEVELYLPGKFEQVRAMPGSASVPALDGSLLDSEEGVKSEIDLIALSLNYSIGWGDISSTTSWLYQNSEVSFDWTRNAAFVGNNWSLTPRDDNYFIQEFQFSSNFNGPLQLLIGAYYEDKKRKSYPVRTFAGDSAKVEELLSSLSWPIPTDAPPGFSYSGWEEFSGRNINTDLLKQHAVYGEISWDITESANFTVGVRHYDYEQSSYHIAVGTIQRRLNPFVQVDVEGENSGESFTANLSWKPNDNTILYLRWAEGFRPGIALQRHSAEFYDPDKTGYYTTLSGEKVPIRNESDPDSLENFEFGFKGVYFDNRLIMNSAIYRIDWEGLPVSVPIINFATGFAQAATTINAGKSISQGIELEVEIILSENFRADFSTSYNDTELAEDRVGLGEKGDNLPGSADFNLTAALEYHFPLAKYDSYVRVDYSYIDEFNSLINQPDSVPLSGGYSQINVKSGIELDNLGIDFFIKNVTNADDISWVTAFSTPAGPTAYRLRPRTIGINFKYSF